jgi:MAF protein
VFAADDQAAQAAEPPAAYLVVAADTIVALDGRQLGKPADAEEAREMLAALRARTHEVITGVALLRASTGTRPYVGSVRTLVEMRDYRDDEIEAYVATGRPLDKAGAYAIQDQDFDPVARIDGCYLNVVGLPLCEVQRGLRALGLPTTEDPDEEYRPPCKRCEAGKAALNTGPNYAPAPNLGEGLGRGP